LRESPQQHTNAVTLGITRHNINPAVAVKVSRGYAPRAWANRYRSRRLKGTASIAQEHAYAVATHRNDVRFAVAIHVGDDEMKKRSSEVEWRSTRFGEPATTIANHHRQCAYFVVSCDDVRSTITVQIRNRSKPGFAGAYRELVWCETALSVS
jgi:hypothetical protein